MKKKVVAKKAVVKKVAAKKIAPKIVKKEAKIVNVKPISSKESAYVISSSDVAKLREATGAGIMNCKKALQDANGDFAKAISFIREKGALIAEKKSERATGAGFLESYTHNGRVAVLMEIRCETDFAGKSEPFRNLAKDLAMQIAAMNPADIKALMTQQFIKDPSMNIEALITATIAKIGENVKVERFVRYEI